MAAAATDSRQAMEKAVAFLNAEFGNDIESLSKAKDLYESINKTKTALESQVRHACKTRHYWQ